MQRVRALRGLRGAPPEKQHLTLLSQRGALLACATQRVPASYFGRSEPIPEPQCSFYPSSNYLLWLDAMKSWLERRVRVPVFLGGVWKQTFSYVPLLSIQSGNTHSS